MIFDKNLMFFQAGTGSAFTSGEYVSLVNNLSLTSSCTSTVINLGVLEDMGIGDGEFVPKLAIYTGSAITSSCSSMQVNLQFQGSTDSTTWTTYGETGYAGTASYPASTLVMSMDVPRRPVGIALPQYYRINMGVYASGLTGTAWIATVGVSTGTLLGGIVIQRADADDTIGRYGAGFSVA